MSKLYLLRPIDDEAGNWEPWYDKAFGFVVRAADELEARSFAMLKAGDEGSDVWVDASQTSCEALENEGEKGILIQDFKSA